MRQVTVVEEGAAVRTTTAASIWHEVNEFHEYQVFFPTISLFFTQVDIMYATTASSTVNLFITGRQKFPNASRGKASVNVSECVPMAFYSLCRTARNHPGIDRFVDLRCGR